MMHIPIEAMSPANQSSQGGDPPWLVTARANAMKYLVLFANNPGIEKIVKEFDSYYLNIKDPMERLERLAAIAAKEWDFRKGRERYEVTETFTIDDPETKLSNIVYEGAEQAEMTRASGATLRHYSIVAVLGGAYRTPYYRLKYALQQPATYDKLALLGSEREVLPPEQAAVKDYAPDAQTEFDLCVGAVKTLMSNNLEGGLDYKMRAAQSRIAYMTQKDQTPILLLSAPPNQGGKRANTADTYDFLREHEGESLNSSKNILFATSSIYRYGQYFDAVREISLKTGTDIEVIGFDPAYGGVKFKPSQILQELKSAADAAIRLRNAVNG